MGQRGCRMLDTRRGDSGKALHEDNREPHSHHTQIQGRTDSQIPEDGRIRFA